MFRDDTPTATLAIALALSLWFVAGSVFQAAVDGFGEVPVRRALVGAVLLAAFGALLWRRDAVQRALVGAPWLVALLGCAVAALAAIDAPVGSPYFSICLAVVGIGVVTSRARTVWAVVLAASTTAAVGAALAYGPEGMAQDGRMGTLVGAVVGAILAALLLLGIRSQLSRFMRDPAQSVLGVREGLANRASPTLQAALASPRGSLLLEAPRQTAGLTPAEVSVVEALAVGRAPKQIAVDRRVSLATVRTQIRQAKRKTGARTLRELASMATRPDWPDVEPL